MKPEDPDLKEKKKVQQPKKNGSQQRRNSIIKLGESSETDRAMARRDSPHSCEKPPGIDAKGKEQDSHANPKPLEPERANEQDVLSKRRQRKQHTKISKSHLHSGKRLSGKGITSLAQIQVSACEALTLQRQSLDPQHGIAAEILQLTDGTTVYI